MNREIDVRHVLPAIRVPTLVIHGVEDTAVPLAAARWMTEQIPGARLVEVAGAGHLHFGRGTDAVNREVRAFVEDIWDSGRWDSVDSDRVLATVLFTDIVDSSAGWQRSATGVARAAGTTPRVRATRAPALSWRGGRHRRRRLLRELRRPCARHPLRAGNRRRARRPGSRRARGPAHGRVRGGGREGGGHRRAHGSACGLRAGAGRYSYRARSRISSPVRHRFAIAGPRAEGCARGVAAVRSG